MAGTATNARITSQPSAAERQALTEFNKLVADVEVVRTGLAALAAAYNLVLTKLDADAGVTDTNYNSLRAVVATTYDTASDLTASIVKDLDGNTIA